MASSSTASATSCDQLAGVRSDDLPSDDPMVGAARDELRETFGLTGRHGSTDRRERHGVRLARRIPLTSGIERQANTRDLGSRIGHRRHEVVANRRLDARHTIDCDHCLVRGLVREKRCADHVAGRTDGRCGRAHGGVGLHEAVAVERHAVLFETEAVGVRMPTSGDQHEVDDLLLSTHRHAETGARTLDAGDLDACPHVDATRCQRALEHLRSHRILGGKHLAGHLGHDDVGPEALQHCRPLAADSSCADDEHPLGQRRESEDAVRVHNSLEVDAGQSRPRRRGAGGDEQMARLDRGVAYDHAALVETTTTGNDLDARALQQRLHSPAQLRHHLVAMGNRPARAPGSVQSVNTPFAPNVATAGGDLDDVQQHLGGDAPAVEADATEITVLDEDDGETPMTRPERGGITRGPAADHGEIDLGHLPSTAASASSVV